ncbi:alanyl-tRNA editing protein [Salinarimonas rosea]|uniref:alanyl-tRNA editing protein n=1 Tax=Salinarimonas rosea TaxID=552063 RepID=UPI000428E520|nr:alanyl-tRNA editing protein [Salinarimonas rosea]
MTEPMFRDDAYLTRTNARVVAVTEKGIVLDRTIFYAQGGGQPGDVGLLRRQDGTAIPVANAVWGEDRSAIAHVPAPDAPGFGDDLIGEDVVAEIDWETRHKRMRIHTALHLLSVVLPYPVTGGAIGDGDGRLDFDLPEAGLDKEEIADELNALIARDAPVSERWISDAELDANPGLVKTMSVQPPRGAGRVRLVAIGDIDLQPCGGTHVKRTSEIGRVLVTDIQKKGKQNRRVRIALADDAG